MQTTAILQRATLADLRVALDRAPRWSSAASVARLAAEINRRLTA
jgi:hypothetical protein